MQIFMVNSELIIVFSAEKNNPNYKRSYIMYAKNKEKEMSGQGAWLVSGRINTTNFKMQDSDLRRKTLGVRYKQDCRGREFKA